MNFGLSHHPSLSALTRGAKLGFGALNILSLAVSAASRHDTRMENSISPKNGRVVLVGAGPGAPDLLTLRAVKALGEADIIIHDGLIDPAVFTYTRPDAQRISVAKKRDRHTMQQGDINALLIAYARAGHIVARLKGGDPFIFGRGGEEVEACRAANVPVEVIPGVSSALGAAAEAQLPLTHRDHASAVSFVAGTCKGLAEQDWSGLVGQGRTLVIYMGVTSAAMIAEKLIDAGAAPDLPVAVLERGTLAGSRVLRTILGDLGDMVTRAKVVSPAILVIGEVALLANAQDLLHHFVEYEGQKTKGIHT
jgi:uroporphyrin-III C-methyltransferase